MNRFVEILQIIAEPSRLKLLCILRNARQNPQEQCSCKTACQCIQKRGLCVYELVKQLGKHQALVSHHLSMLKRVQLVHSQRLGQKIYYEISDETLDFLEQSFKTVFHLE